MQFWKRSDRCRRVGILLFDAFSMHCLANAVEPLRAANGLARRQLYSWQFLSLDGAVVTSSSGLPVHPGAALSRAEPGEHLFVMPSYRFRALATPATTRALRAARARFSTLVAMDTGAWLLAAAGLLDGRRTTIHWDECDAFAEAFPEVRLCPDRVVDDGDILSCGGGSTACDLLLDLIEAHHGAMLRLEVASTFMQQGIGPHPARPSQAGRESLVSLMRRNLERPLGIAALAARLGMTQKTLERRCRHEHRLTPRGLYRGIRLREARRLAETTGLSVEEIALRCGYRNASAMTRAFRREFGLSPSSLRRSLPAR